MKKLALFLIPILLLSLSGKAQTLSYNNNNGNDNYTLSGVSSFIDQNNDNGVYSYTWYFSNGSYITGVLQTDPNNSTSNTISSTYTPSGSNKWAKIELVKRYDDTDKPKLFIINDGLGNPADFLTPEELKLEMPLQPRKGDTVTYIFKYSHRCDSDSSGTISFTFDPNIVNIIDTDLITSETNAESIASVSSSSSIWQASYSNLLTSEARHIFLRLKFLETTVNESPFELKIESSDKRCSTTVRDTFEIMAKQSPHDPNYIVGSIKSICPKRPYNPSGMDYWVVFQNDGDWHCDSVKIKLELPECFKFGQTGVPAFTTVDPAGITCSTNVSGREITWLMKEQFLKDNNYLMGLNQDGMTNINFDKTMDSLRFSVTFDPNYDLLPCSVIPINAEITFNNLESLTTRDFLLEVECDSCKECRGDSRFKILSEVLACNNEAQLFLPQNLDLEGAQVLWQPSTGLDNPRSFSPKVKVKEDTWYYASVVKNCHRKLYKILVKAPRNNPLCCCCKKTWPWWYFAVPAVLLLVLFWNYRPRS